jgi:hypothetical protein
MKDEIEHVQGERWQQYVHNEALDAEVVIICPNCNLEQDAYNDNCERCKVLL